MAVSISSEIFEGVMNDLLQVLVLIFTYTYKLQVIKNMIVNVAYKLLNLIRIKQNKMGLNLISKVFLWKTKNGIFGFLVITLKSLTS